MPQRPLRTGPLPIPNDVALLRSLLRRRAKLLRQEWERLVALRKRLDDLEAEEAGSDY